jgi:hypothetical protein
VQAGVLVPYIEFLTIALSPFTWCLMTQCCVLCAGWRAGAVQRILHHGFETVMCAVCCVQAGELVPYSEFSIMALKQ